ncbi:MAG: serine/threonine-protein kinase, partial [Planctomycetota bacterium]
MTTRMDDLTSRQIEKYRVLGRHASGGFSVLWKAHYANNKRKYVAIKLMLPEKAKSRSDRPLFEREYKICRGFDHPALLKYHSYGVHNSLPYLVMDFFDGKNLKALIAERSELVRVQAGRIAGAVAAGLGYIHAQGIVHRDIKPENILVAADGGARLIDFSIAQTKWQRLNPFDRGLHGTPSYLAPEVVQGKCAGSASDIYALGA